MLASEKKLHHSTLRWLERNHHRVFLPRRDADYMSFGEMSTKVRVCVDTLKRIMVAEGFASFESDRYRPSRSKSIAMWNRPCMKCRCTKSRPRGKYICTPCKTSMGWQDDD